MTVLFFKPIPKTTIWGKTVINDYFKYPDMGESVGQVWSFSGIENDSTICVSGKHKGKNLYELWRDNQELFGYRKGKFPLIISLVGPVDDLSIQVHPDDTYAKKIGFDSGKNEAWYFIEAKEDASIVYGHKAKNEEELNDYIKHELWYDLIDHLKVKKDDFVYLPSGLLHALGKGSIVYEIQQATDITYRFFDYHRKDDLGNERQLHLEEAIACLSYDKTLMKNNINKQVIKEKNLVKTTYISNDSFSVSKLEIGGECKFIDKDSFQLATVIKGEGFIDNEKVKLGDNFLIPINQEILIKGQLVIMITTKYY